MSFKDVFINRSEYYESLEKEYSRRLHHLGNLRLIAFLAGAAGSAYGYFTGGPAWAAGVLLLFLPVFITLIMKYSKMKKDMEIAGAMLEIQRRYLSRIDGTWVRFEDCGLEFVDSSHPYTYDLDVFGRQSLFQMISVAQTVVGRNHLKALLAGPSRDIETINKRQSAVKELGANLEFCQRLQCQGLLADGMLDSESLVDYAEEPLLLSKAISIIRVLPVFTGLGFLMSWGGWMHLWVPMLLLSVQGLIFVLGFWKIQPELNRVYLFHKKLEVFKNMFRLIESEEFEDDYLSVLRSGLQGEKAPASVGMKKLEKISDAIDLRYQPIVYFILGILLLWDFHCVLQLERWKNENGGKVREWFEIIGAFEALSSLSVILHIYPEWVFPEIQEHGMGVMAQDVGHPLLQQDKCVRNDIEIRQYSCIVTGSNMSGKSTYLRAVGLNLVLAYSGTSVCAREFCCSMLDIYTSMVIRDDLMGGISTFFAELTRIEMILKHSRQGRPMIYLIDEIFRGTNSLDRIAGARTVLRELSRNGAIGLISTHDFELCDLEEDQEVSFRNCHFEEQYVEGGIKFDYILRPGRCTTSNARYLMNMVGIQVPE
ncbi:MAG: DNA mismatch repair protein MutS [Syntrophomonadaceae bacterium]|nr:DNA mismatch repair protein MutS [Syntrophomonadaceae bacterium]